MENKKERFVCHIDTDKTDKTYDSVDKMTDDLVAKYGLSSKDQVNYVYNGATCYDIRVKSKLGDTMRIVGFYYKLLD